MRLLIAAAWMGLCAPSIAHSPPRNGAAPHPRSLPTLQRMVRHFDFEEAEIAPYDMPLNFYRYGADEAASAQGFPPFGTMRLTNDVAYSGNWSFEFSLDGGSLAARVPTAVIPAVPLADYTVAAKVRTLGLKHARARLVAWLHDTRGNIIQSSRVATAPIDTAGAWETIFVEVRGDYENAMDLVVELQLVQPRQYMASTLAATDGPLLEDVAGRAWFDDITVWHQPRIEMNTSQPGNTVESAQQTQLTVLVRDLTHEDLQARLRVYDIDGRRVHDELFPAPRMPRPRTVLLPVLDHGWYQAVLDVTSGSTLVARRSMNFVQMPPVRRSATTRDTRFGVSLDDGWAHHADQLMDMLSKSRVGAVVLPMWSGTPAVRRADLTYERYRRLIGKLVSSQLHLSIALPRLPDALARSLDISREDVLTAFARDGSLWRDYLDELLEISVEVHHWQLGSPGATLNGSNGTLQESIDAATAALAELVPSPVVALPLTAEQAVPSHLRLDARTIFIPADVQPEGILEYARLWNENESPISAVLELAPQGRYSRRDRLIDLMFRALYGTRAGLSNMTIAAPWHAENAPNLEPDPEFIVWRQVCEHLNGRRFAGEVRLGQGKTCWIFQGDGPGDDALVAWADGAVSKSMHMQLADGDVQVVDFFGNARTVSLIDGSHDVALGETPVFIEGVSLPLVQFRGGFVLDPPFIPSEHRTHEHDIVLHNPWDMPIAGTMQILELPQWKITPRSQEFTIPARGSVRLPVEVVFDRSVLAGPTQLEAEVRLRADGNYRLTLATDVQVGLRHLDFSTTWRIVQNAETGRDDLVITQYITNTGPELIYADAYLIAPRLRQERRLIAGLEPGEMAVRMFQIPDGAAALAGESIRITVSDRNGIGRLNREIQVPEFATSQQAAVPTE